MTSNIGDLIFKPNSLGFESDAGANEKHVPGSIGDIIYYTFA